MLLGAYPAPAQGVGASRAGRPRALSCYRVRSVEKRRARRRPGLAPNWPRTGETNQSLLA
nr:MAG TPA: hypothetical protein [Caudoviricetes sp.]